jgi:16S rRNA (guanine966-N2)-methyltransferase
MTRIIAGAAGGRRLATPPGQATRPTSDRAREGLFATVLSMRGSLAGCGVLDLYAGSGAVGLEALSRGAGDVLLIESDPRAARVIRANMAVVGLPGARLICGHVGRVLARGPEETGARDLVFADPPYALADAELGQALAALADCGWLAAGAIIVVERATRSGELTWPGGYRPDRSRTYGEATLWYGLAEGARGVRTAPTGA